MSANQAQAKPQPAPIRVLFLWRHRAAHAHLAEQLLNHLGQGRFVAMSAGRLPATADPIVAKVLGEIAIAADKAGSRSSSECDGDGFDYVITLCDRSTASCSGREDQCPSYPGHDADACWGFGDRRGSSQPIDELSELRQVRDQIMARLRIWIPAVQHARQGASRRA